MINKCIVSHVLYNLVGNILDDKAFALMTYIGSWNKSSEVRIMGLMPKII